MAGMRKSNAIIFSQGEYRLPSDSVYVEILGKSSDPVFVPGTENEISVERLHDNLIKLSFSMPDKEKTMGGVLVPCSVA